VNLDKCMGQLLGLCITSTYFAAVLFTGAPKIFAVRLMI